MYLPFPWRTHTRSPSGQWKGTFWLPLASHFHQRPEVVVHQDCKCPSAHLYPDTHKSWWPSIAQGAADKRLQRIAANRANSWRPHLGRVGRRSMTVTVSSWKFDNPSIREILSVLVHHESKLFKQNSFKGVRGPMAGQVGRNIPMRKPTWVCGVDGLKCCRNTLLCAVPSIRCYIFSSLGSWNFWNIQKFFEPLFRFNSTSLGSLGLNEGSSKFYTFLHRNFTRRLQLTPGSDRGTFQVKHHMYKLCRSSKAAWSNLTVDKTS